MNLVMYSTGHRLKIAYKQTHAIRVAIVHRILIQNTNKQNIICYMYYVNEIANNSHTGCVSYIRDRIERKQRDMSRFLGAHRRRVVCLLSVVSEYATPNNPHNNLIARALSLSLSCSRYPVYMCPWVIHSRLGGAIERQTERSIYNIWSLM